MLPENDDYLRDDEDWDAELDLVNRFTERVIEKHENCFFDSDDMLVIIENYLQNEQIDMARAAVNHAYNFFPSDPDIALKDAKITMVEGNLGQAYKLIQKAKIGCDEIEYYFTLGQYYALRNEHEKSIDTYFKALSLTDDPYERSNIHYGLASQYMSIKQYDKAINNLKKSAINADSFHREIIFLDLRHCYQYSNRLDEAIRYFNEYIDKDPNCLAAWNSLADCYRKLEKYDEAIEYYEYALAINPIDAYANINLTNIYYDREQYQKTLEIIFEAIDNGMPETNDTSTIIADCLYNLNKPSKAESYYRKALEICPNDTNAWSGLGFIYSDSKRYDKAIQYLKKGISQIKDENCLEVMLTLAEAYEKNDNEQEAVETLLQIIEQWPDDPAAYCILAKICIHEKDFTSAYQTLAEGLVKTNHNTSVEYYMAYLMLLTNKRENAFCYLSAALEGDLESYQDFINLDPKFLGNDVEVLEMINKYKKELES